VGEKRRKREGDRVDAAGGGKKKKKGRPPAAREREMIGGHHASRERKGRTSLVGRRKKREGGHPFHPSEREKGRMEEGESNGRKRKTKEEKGYQIDR